MFQLSLLLITFSIFLIVLFAVLIVLLTREIGKQSKYRKTRHKYSKKNTKKINRYQNIALGKLEARLLSLVRDRATAMRLVNNIQFRHPTKNLTWCYEKVILDLERDRH